MGYYRVPVRVVLKDQYDVIEADSAEQAEKIAQGREAARSSYSGPADEVLVGPAIEREKPAWYK